MKLFLLALSGIVAASASSDVTTLRGSSANAGAAAESAVVTEYYAPPKPTSTSKSDLKTLWEELEAEAAFMQVMITTERNFEQCEDDCNAAVDLNRARCRRNCEQIDDAGGSSETRTANCADCRTLPTGGNRQVRCYDACQQARDSGVQACNRAQSCVECRRECGTGVVLDDCLDDFNCPGQDRSEVRDCHSANTCGECNSFCSNGNDRRDCRNDLCSAEELAKFEGVFIQK